jgi:hypothetical protein
VPTGHATGKAAPAPLLAACAQKNPAGHAKPPAVKAVEVDTVWGTPLTRYVPAAPAPLVPIEFKGSTYVPARTLGPRSKVPATMDPALKDSTVSVLADVSVVLNTSKGTLTAYVPAPPVPVVSA